MAGSNNRRNIQRNDSILRREGSKMKILCFYFYQPNEVFYAVPEGTIILPIKYFYLAFGIVFTVIAIIAVAGDAIFDLIVQ